MSASTRGKLDRLIERFTSRKLLVWVVASGLMVVGTLESGDWVIVSALYLGGQSIIDAVAKLRGHND
jgi:hypothetical protein|tara:strand:- start:428 stop:628 length:201 start_codon:yes stop_codon:yes gene_type:complete